MNKNIGELVEQRRAENRMTLEDISEATEFSIGYLSQLERGLAFVAHDTLKKVAKVLGVEMTYSMEQSKTKERAVLYSYEWEILCIEGSSIIEYTMTDTADRGEMLPKLAETPPQKGVEESLPYPHKGKGFVYVLEGTLTLQIEDDVCDLYPRDCARYKPTRIRNRSNQTNKIVKFITINTPNLFQEAGEKL